MNTLEKPKEVYTVKDMRDEIQRLRLENVLVYKVMYSADIKNVSEEDRYTALAYYALIDLYNMKEAFIKHIESERNTHVRRVCQICYNKVRGENEQAETIKIASEADEFTVSEGSGISLPDLNYVIEQASQVYWNSISQMWEEE